MQQQQPSDQQHQHLQAAGPGHHLVNAYHHQASAHQMYIQNSAGYSQARYTQNNLVSPPH